jgi:hypothetical protein
VLTSKFPLEPLERALTEFFGDVKLGDEEISTGLMVVTKRLDTGSPWIIHNNPRGKFFGSDGSWIPNKDYLLREVVRASSAAPHFFEPEGIQIAADVEGAFVDGGVSPFNNPALPALMLATLDGYGLKWPFGADNLMVVSVGTGSRTLRMETEKLLKMPAAALAGLSVISIMADCDALNQTILQWMSQSPVAWQIDSEVEDLRHDALGSEPLIHYLRYNIFFDEGWLKREINVDMDPEEVGSLFAMDQPKNVNKLAELGTTAGLVQVKADQFPASFDLA